ncbi:hypothetical protein D9619_006041 [Psilocybe cf. subviscida]|uniref:U3 small nucleolar RNA-associated protein 6 N-terminal domain-containing protein n=1 Tax=Psilocybe cf. subviscida TaxID=2480587 RepID=A0A8H5BW68_9AGAR|nr:hypothetical protein D9619_006041 [Psilocybe cf. subviscida]
MERVYFQQEQMLDELKDLVDKGLFTEQETKAIMKKRTALETALVRRVAKKSDFVRYAAYEMGLEQLRRKRRERLQIKTGPPTLSDYALVRRQFHIFERAVKKFKSDVALWVQYIQVAKREGARALTGRLIARAIQLHPSKPGLFILGAQHELDQQAVSSARALLQRGIRMNGTSVEMWTEYVRMELGFVESLRRRWAVLGISVPGDGDAKASASKEDKEKKEKKKSDPSNAIMGEKVEDELHAGGDAAEAEEMYHEKTDAGAEARRAVMDGAIVASVIDSAVKAIPRYEMVESLMAVISSYPCAEALRTRLLDALAAAIASNAVLVKDARSVVHLAGRHIPSDVDASNPNSKRKSSTAMVRGLRAAAEEILRVNHAAYSAWMEEWCAKDIDPSLKEWLRHVGRV